MSVFGRVMILLSLAVALSAQIPDAAAPKPDANTPAQTDEKAQPVDPAAAPPSTVIDATAEDQTVPVNSGPGILSRTFTTTPLENQQLRFRPWFSVSAIVDDGLTSPTVNSNGQVANSKDWGVLNRGVDVGFGISGRRLYKHDTFELELNGDAFAYAPTSTYDGGNYLLMATYKHEFNRRISLAFTENGSLFSNNYSLPNATTDLSLGGTSQLVTANTQIFDNTTLSLSSGVDLVIQATNRLSFDFGGTGFLVKRDSSILYGTVGSQARADTTYRLTRHVTIGGYYGFTDYQFSHAFGGSLTNTVGTEFSEELTKSLQLRLRLGGSRVVTIGTQTIVLDPVIAAILGESSGIIAIHRTNYVPDLTAQLAKTFKVGTASLEYVENVTPGNGIILTSRHILASGHYDYNGFRRWTLSIGASRDALETLGILIGSYSSYIGHIGVARTMSHGFQTNLVAEYRHFDLSGDSLLKNAFRITLGVAWSPSERPVNFN